MSATEITPNVYNTVPAWQPEANKPGQLSQAQLETFFRDGYVVLENFFDTESDLQPCRDAIEAVVDDLANRLLKGGKIQNLHKELGLFQRLTAIEAQYEGASVLLHKTGICPEAIRKLWTHEKLLNIAEQLIGPNVAGHPVWNWRPKVPNTETGVVPWHQDSAYLDDDASKILQVTSWIPLLDASEENGCLQLMRGGQRRGKLAPHHGCWGNTWYLQMDERSIESTLGVNLVSDIVTVPVKYGGLVLFSNMLPHRSLENPSDKIRWSLDLRWQDATKRAGFYGLKECIAMRLEGQPDYKPDWESFCKKKEVSGIPADPFDTIFVGPGMSRWPITHENKHTRAMKALQEKNVNALSLHQD